jgi:hypothetical protein
MVTDGVKSALVVGLCMLGCGARPHAAPATHASDEVTLYRDLALVQQHVEIVVPSTRSTIAIKVAAGVRPDDVTILDRGELTVSARDAQAAGAPDDEPDDEADDEPDDEAGDEHDEPDDEADSEPASPAPRRRHTAPTELVLVVEAPRPGRYAVSIGYVTDRLVWDAAYTMTMTAARDRAVLRGAIAIRNTSGLVLHARTHTVDGELGASRQRAVEELTSAIRGKPAQAPVARRDLGLITLGDGETRVELLAGDAPRKPRSVLVYDPIGTRLDHPGAAPVADPALGSEASVSARVTESLEIRRAGPDMVGLPAGPARVLERRRDGLLAPLGEARLFDASNRVADVDSLVVGTAAGVTGQRERRGWAKDDDLRRFSEEFLITIDNARPWPVEVVIREHLYRGQNWTLAYQSAPATKEGAQQIALRTLVPANGRARVLYVVVNTW